MNSKANSTKSPTSRRSDPAIRPVYLDPQAPLPARVDDLLARMTLDEKIGQMTQVEKNSLTYEDATRYFIGSVLSGGGGYPANNSPSGWLQMVMSYQEAAMQTRLGIPLLYGVDAVHGHNNMREAVIFPHNIGLGAAGDADLVYRIGNATAEEMAAVGVRWNFAPMVAVPQDIRWGRTFEGYSEEENLVSELASAYIHGLQGDDLAAPTSVVATAKHYLGDGATTWGTSGVVYPALVIQGIEIPRHFMIDQGDVSLDEARLRGVHLKPYIAAVQAGAQTVMASFSSWNGEKMHAHSQLLTGVMKGELGMPGFIVTDWGGIDLVLPDYDQAVVACINAGIDMSMVPQDFLRFIQSLKQAVERGQVSMERIDDAVRRILSVKFKLGLFEHPATDPGLFSLVGSLDHRELAREAVARSLVLLKNEGQALPLAKALPLIYVAGAWADDIGLQCGGWTIEWLGKSGAITPGTTLLDAIRASVSPETAVRFHPTGEFEPLPGAKAAAGVVVIGELPYAEGLGDRADLTLTAPQKALIERMRPLCERLIVILISGRPLVLGEESEQIDALVAAWLPGTEGQGVADVLFGDQPFCGKLPYTWPRTMDQIPLSQILKGGAGADPLYPRGFGLTG